MLDAGMKPQTWPYLKDGEKVVVTTGPLTGVTGIVVREKRADRLVVTISLLMRSVAVKIDRRNVCAVSDADLDKGVLGERSSFGKVRVARNAGWQ
jgi:hypothetical protein